ncbi:hypothetical protein DEV91_12916 [Phyllobacterium brassicacearum]|nr:hypothetical protein DEV91_12916 [Phyllobacterium brassicacearum]
MSMLKTPIGTLNSLITSSLFLTLPVWEEDLGGYPALISGGQNAPRSPLSAVSG